MQVRTEGQIERVALFSVIGALGVFQGTALGLELFRDEFDQLNFGTIWQSHGSGIPEISLGIGHPAHSSSSLHMFSDGFGEEFRGIETIAPISLAGLDSVTVDVRLAPINGGVSGTLSSAEVALVGSSGDFVRAFASNNPSGTNSDWADFYEDSAANSFSSGAYAHCDFGGCDSFRRFLITVGKHESQLVVRNSDDSPNAFGAFVSNFSLDDLGSELRIALRQQSVDRGDPVQGWIDSVLVTGVEQIDVAPVAGRNLLRMPFSQFTSSRWQVRNLAGQSKFNFTSYNNPTGLSTLQQYTTRLRLLGLANGIDLGSSPRSSVLPEYGHIKSLGWSFTAWPGAADHQVDGGSGLEPEHETVLATLDRPGVVTPIHFGEWGYYFHELSTDMRYFASIYPGQDPSSYAHLMKAPGSKGYDSFPVNRVDAYNQLRAYYMSRDSDWGGRISSVTGHSHYEVYAAEWGSPTIGLEIGENIRFTQSKFAFARGAARQWEKPWSTQVSPWFHGSLTTVGPLTGGRGNARGQDAGHSFSFYKRAWLHSWFAGAARVTPEFSMGNLFETNDGPWDLTELGELAVEVTEVMNTHDRGVPYAPVAILIDQYAGYNSFQDKPWGVFSKTAGDLKTYDLFQHQLFPGSANSNSPDAANPEAPYLVATPYGEMFDVLTTTAEAPVLGFYPELLLVGNVSFTPGFITSLETALAGGSRLLLQQDHVAAMGSTAFDLLQAAGEVVLLDEWHNSVTGRSAAISNSVLSQLHDLHMPVSITGDQVQYQLNRNAEGWVVELINNTGVVKAPHLPAVVDLNETVTVSLEPLVDAYGGYDWLTGEWFGADSGAWNIDVAAGDVRFIQIMAAFEADFDLDGDVDGRDFLRWQIGVGGFDGNASRSSGDANGDGNVDHHDMTIWHQQAGSFFERPALEAVPEPSSFTVLGVSLCGILLESTIRLKTQSIHRP